MSSTKGPLAGKVYIVTGSSAGIGEATVLALASEGASVVVNYSRSQEPAEDVARRCIAAGGDAIAVRADVSDDAQCIALTQAALTKWGRIDGLVNNAGYTKFVTSNNLAGLSAADFQAIYGVNVVGPFQMVRACEQALRATKGAVVNVSSIAGQDALGSCVAYAASKGALNTLTLALARALGPDVRVNAVLPGFIEGGWLKAGLGASYEASHRAYRSASALEAALAPEDIAANIVWLLRSPKVTAQLLRVDAGKNVGRTPGSKPL